MNKLFNCFDRFSRSLDKKLFDAALAPVLLMAYGIPLLLIIVIVALVSLAIILIIRAKQKQDYQKKRWNQKDHDHFDQP